MKAEELRIGNWVECVLSDKKVKVEGITKTDTSFGNYYYIEYNNGSKTVLVDFDGESYVSGLALTPEILEKCGFVKDPDGCLKFGNCLYWLDNGFLQIASGYAPIINCPCKYIHQLQNLHYAFYGTDLQVNLT